MTSHRKSHARCFDIELQVLSKQAFEYMKKICQFKLKWNRANSIFQVLIHKFKSVIFRWKNDSPRWVWAVSRSLTRQFYCRTCISISIIIWLMDFDAFSYWQVNKETLKAGHLSFSSKCKPILFYIETKIEVQYVKHHSYHGQPFS